MKPILLFLLTCAMWGQGKPQASTSGCDSVDTCTIRINEQLDDVQRGIRTSKDVENEFLDMSMELAQLGDAKVNAIMKPHISKIKEMHQAPKPAVSSDKKPTCVEQGDCNNYVTGLITKGFDDDPAPKPSFTVEKAVKVKSAPPDVECWYSSDGRPIPGKTMCNNLIPVTQYSCPKRPGYSTFLLPDESTGEKVCLNVLKEKP